MSPKGWTKHPRGQVSVFPVTGWRTASAMQGKAGALRIEFATEPKMEKRDAKQFLMAPQQLRALSDELRILADKLEADGDDTPETPVN